MQTLRGVFCPNGATFDIYQNKRLQHRSAAGPPEAVAGFRKPQDGFSEDMAGAGIFLENSQRFLENSREPSGGRLKILEIRGLSFLLSEIFKICGNR
ncbi:MAG: hypothetical protein NC116_06370 [Clostridium sp.]|nr:hypothetical protein [Bacteroidales bacterium]MCM1510325.1 hypothetical protein [Clostridium sp.]